MKLMIIIKGRMTLTINIVKMLHAAADEDDDDDKEYG